MRPLSVIEEECFSFLTVDSGHLLPDPANLDIFWHEHNAPGKEAQKGMNLALNWPFAAAIIFAHIEDDCEHSNEVGKDEKGINVHGGRICQGRHMHL